MEDIKERFFGKLAHLQEDTIKRIVMRLLIWKVLKEKFNSFKVEQTILVYVIPGRKLESFKKAEIKIVMTDCLNKDDEKARKQEEARERKEKAKDIQGRGDHKKSLVELSYEEIAH